jgi:hypothetical protein
MASPFGGGSPNLKETLAKFQELGCEIRSLTGPIGLAGKMTPTEIRYVLNPANQKYVFIQNIPDTQPVGWSMLRNWERRLGVNTGY